MKLLDVFSTPSERDDGMKAIIGKLPAAIGGVFRATWESIQRVHPAQGGEGGKMGEGPNDRGMAADPGRRSI
jgi:hypothetical protein